MIREDYKTLRDAVEGKSDVYFPAFMEGKMRDVLDRAVGEEAVIDASMFLWKYIPGLKHEEDAIREVMGYRHRGDHVYVRGLVEKLQKYHDNSVLMGVNASLPDIMEIGRKVITLEKEKKHYEDEKEKYDAKKSAGFSLFKKEPSERQIETLKIIRTNLNKIGTEINELKAKRRLYEDAIVFKKSPEYNEVLKERSENGERAKPLEELLGSPARAPFQAYYDEHYKPKPLSTSESNSGASNKKIESMEKKIAILEALVKSGSRGLSREEIDLLIEARLKGIALSKGADLALKDILLKDEKMTMKF